MKMFIVPKTLGYLGPKKIMLLLHYPRHWRRHLAEAGGRHVTLDVKNKQLLKKGGCRQMSRPRSAEPLELLPPPLMAPPVRHRTPLLTVVLTAQHQSSCEMLLSSGNWPPPHNVLPGCSCVPWTHGGPDFTPWKIQNCEK